MKKYNIKISNYSSRAANAKINTIIIHHTAMSSVDSVLSWFKNPASQVSSHYVIDKNGDIYQLVPNDKKAWHAGVSHWKGVDNLNHYSIGIELVNTGYEPFDEKQIESLIELCKELKAEYNIDDQNIIGHSDVAPGRKIDPSQYFDWGKLHDEGLGIMSNIKMENPEVLLRYGDENSDVLKLKSELVDFGYLLKNSDQNRYDVELDYAIKAFKRHYCQETYDCEGWDTLTDAKLHDLLEQINEPYAKVAGVSDE